jgi:hypothetical protein
MPESHLKKIGAIALWSLSATAYAITTQGIHGEFNVGLGPLSLGKVTMVYNCEADVCHYETRVKGSFMWVDAYIHEQGSYIQDYNHLSPVSTHYEEKIGSKHKEYQYDFLSMEIQDAKDKKRIKLADIAYPYTLLLNQVALDLRNGTPKKYYDYLSNQKVKRATVTAYHKTPTARGILHQLITERKDDNLEFYFLQVGNSIRFERLEYKSFNMKRAN